MGAKKFSETEVLADKISTTLNRRLKRNLVCLNRSGFVGEEFLFYDPTLRALLGKKGTRPSLKKFQGLSSRAKSYSNLFKSPVTPCN